MGLMPATIFPIRLRLTTKELGTRTVECHFWCWSSVHKGIDVFEVRDERLHLVRSYGQVLNVEQMRANEVDVAR